ncbi:MAG TPA: L,D-transpeptidase family protein [Cyclobacteriaceae bacterium]|nr:L,D-transpeptidase family protein [Cyclobacteriaceae bacterium]
MKLSFFAVITLSMISFKDSQLQHARVKEAYRSKEETVKSLFKTKHLQQDGFNLFIRAFKKEGKLEAWIKEKHNTNYTLLTTYDFCTTSGTAGPKRKEGDLQIPEGIYHINHFNPQSNFYLSLGINYPNASDKILSDRQKPGGEIYIHGNCVTIGCIPITDDKIKELYILAVEARNNGQEKIPVHIFPCRMDDSGMKSLEGHFAKPDLISFWNNLKDIYLDFEQTHLINPMTIDKTGRYVLTR